MPDELLDLLGDSFVSQKFHERLGVTFEWFLLQWEIGTLDGYFG